MQSTCNSRMKREIEMMKRAPPPGISCWMKDDDVTRLEAKILGGESTPYAEGVFKLDIHIPDRYPFEPPKVQYVTPIYHPNIDTSGRICLDLLKMPPAGNWKPSLNISTVLTSLQLLMAEPNPDDPLMADISAEFKHNRAVFVEKAKQWTKTHATQDMQQTSASTDDSSEESSSESDSEESSDDEENKSANQNTYILKSSNQNSSTKSNLVEKTELTNERRGEKRCLQEVNGELLPSKKSDVVS
nr:ubiquitin-conjugating enzyme E2 T-like [Lytechinus pictus]